MTHDATLTLRGHERMSDNDWPGVVARLSHGWRIAVSGNGSGYRLQQLTVQDGKLIWWPVGGRSLPAKLIAEWSHKVPGLAEAFASLPADPRETVSELIEANADLQERVDTSRVSSPRYCRVVSQSGQMRIAVDPTGYLYLVQWVASAEAGSDRAFWRTLIRLPSASAVERWLNNNAYDPDDGGWWSGDQTAIAHASASLVDGLAEWARDGVWQSLPSVIRRLGG